MNVGYRRVHYKDIPELFEVRSQTRENPISKARLAQMGITHVNIAKGFEAGALCGWVCLSDGEVVGFCTGDTGGGEILALAILPDFEGQGIGKQLLEKVVDELLQKGLNPVWLAADSNPNVRANGFYRYLGWRPTGRVLDNGDEILELYGTA
ncbi:GNAT family N-acetyltransferase [Vreelandella stevensii]|uniref:GNAT family N-acetyltransferase n=1 Tax=Vreelandella stevensii TaxID=502821 RepID=UPI0037484646